MTDLPPVDSRFQVPKDHLLNRQQANVVFRSRGLIPWNATEEDNDIYDVLTWIDNKLGKHIQTLIGRYLPSGLGALPSTIWATLPTFYSNPDVMTIYAKMNNPTELAHDSDDDTVSSEESSSSESSSFWESDPDPDSASEMDIDPVSDTVPNSALDMEIDPVSDTVPDLALDMDIDQPVKADTESRVERA